MEFKAIETQEELDRIIADRLSRERAKSTSERDALMLEKSKVEKELGEVKSALEKTSDETKNYKDELEKAKTKLSSYEMESMRTKIGLQNGLPYELTGRLVGKTTEELEKDAKRLSEFLGRHQPIAPLKDTERKTEDDPYKKLLSNVKGD